MTPSRELIQEIYIRICKDSGFKMDYIQAAILTANVLNADKYVTHALEVWSAIGSFSLMEEIATGKHPVTK